MAISARDKALPTQAFCNRMWRGGGSYEDALATYLTVWATERLPKLEIAAPKDAPSIEEMSSPPPLLALLLALAQWKGARRILEVGTFAGMAALHLAHGTGASVTTIECQAAGVAAAKANARRNGLAGRVDVRRGDARAVLLSELQANHYDLVYIDGGKQFYPDLARMAERLIVPDGLIVVDDVFFHGDALNDPPRESKGRGARALLDHYRHRSDFNALLLPLGNGVLILWRK